MKKMIALVLGLAGLLSLCACGAGNSGKTQADWLTYEEVSNHVKNERGQEIFVYSYRQPVLSSQSDAATLINNKLGNATTAFLYGSGGVQELTELAQMDWKEPQFSCYALNRDVSVARMDEVLVSFRFVDYAFTGGIHGYTGEYGVTYDMTTGQQLRLSDLTADEAALKKTCLEYIRELLASEDYPYRDQLLPNYDSSLEGVLENWVFTDRGLQFIAQPYVLASYAAGTLRFTVPYRNIAHVLDNRWMPVQRSGSTGGVQVTQVSDQQPGLTNFMLDSQGATMLAQVSGTIYNFSAEGVKSVWDGENNQFVVTRQYLFSPQVTGENFGLQLPVSEREPAALLCYEDREGNEFQYYLMPDGKGGVTLQPVEVLLDRDQGV